METSAVTRVSPLDKCRCDVCPLAVDGKPKHKPVLGYGPETARVVLVGEAPGKEEVASGKPFVGMTGDLVKALCDEVKLPHDDVYLTNTTLCVPLDGSKAPSAAIQACRPRLVEEIKRQKPKMVLSMGAFAVKSLLKTETGITQLEGAIYDVPELGVRVLPTFHPAAVLRGMEVYFDNILDAFKRVKTIVVDGIDPPQIDFAKFPIRFYEPHEGLEGLKALERQLEGATRDSVRWALDYETDALLPLEGNILQVGIFDGVQAHVFNYKGKVRLPDGSWSPSPLPGWGPEGDKLFAKLLRDERVHWVMHNKKFEYTWSYDKFGVQEIANSNDTMCLALGLTENQQHVGLGNLSRRWFNAPPYWEEMEKWFLYKDKKRRTFDQVPRDVLGKYLALDCIYTWHLEDPLTRACEVEGTLPLTRMLNEYQKLFSKMEYTGVEVDLEYVSEVRRIWEPIVKEAERQLVLMAREAGFDARRVGKGGSKKKRGDLNPGSWQQLQNYFYDILKLRPVYNNKRKLTTGKEFREKYKDHPAVKKLIEYRTVKKMLSTYVTGIAALVSRDGRVHPDILVFGARTGRLAIKNPPLQTIPKEERLKVKFNSLRKLFKAKQGYKIVEVDYAQLEMRIAWHYSKDPILGEALKAADFHQFMASRIFNVPYDQVTKAQRHQSKFVTFGILYGRQAPSIAQELKISIKEAQALIDLFFKEAPLLHQWWKDTQKLAVDQGWLETPLKRRRRWGLITPRNLQEVKNQAVNFPVQSLASDLTVLQAIKLDKMLRELGWGHCLFPVHDAIIFEIRDERVDEAVPLIAEVMCDPPFETCAKFEVDVGVGPNWGELKKVKLSA